MHIITGGTGHVGSALAGALLKKNEPVTIITRSSANAKEWIDQGAQIAVADIYDTEALHEIFKTGNTIFVLNPPADPMTDTSAQERKTIASLLQALKDLNLKKLVVESTLGAQPGENIGDLGVLYELEEGIVKLPYEYSIIRPAYYMSNWMESLPVIKEKGELMSFYPAGLKLPMVAATDIAELAAHLLTENDTPKLNPIIGPEEYSPNDVAAAFSQALGKEIKVKVIPKEAFEETYKSLGFSDKAAESFSRMTRITLEGGFEMPKDSIRGKTSLLEYIKTAVEAKTHKPR